MTQQASAGQDPATDPASGTPDSTPPASAAQPAGPATQPNATPAQPQLPSQMPNLDDDSAWNGLPSWVKALRTENARHRTENKTLAEKVAALEREKMSEVERLRADLQRATQETIPSLNQTIQHLRVQVAAGAKGIVDPEAAAALLDWEAVKAGTSIEDALDALVSARPWLKGAAQAQPAAAPASTTSPAAPAGGSGKRVYTEAEIARMSEAEYDAAAADIMQAMAEGRIRK